MTSKYTISRLNLFYSEYLASKSEKKLETEEELKTINRLEKCFCDYIQNTMIDELITYDQEKGIFSVRKLLYEADRLKGPLLRFHLVETYY